MFDFDALIHEAKHEPFEFKMKGKVYRLPHPLDLPLGGQRYADRGLFDLLVLEEGEVYEPSEDDPGEGEWRKAGQAGAAVFLEKYDDQIAGFRVAYLAHGGLKPGESRASSR